MIMFHQEIMKILLKIIQASNLSRAAINITKTTAPHALSYALTSYFQIPHGNAVAILLPETFKVSIEKMLYSITKSVLKFCLYLKVMTLIVFVRNGGINESLQFIYESKTFGVNYSDVEFIASKVNLET